MKENARTNLPLINTTREITEREVIEWLVQSSIFANLSDQDLRPLMGKIRVMNFKPMDEVIVQGRFSAALYIVTAGRFLVLRPTQSQVHPSTSSDDLMELDTFTAGHCFGEYSLMDQQPASASVVAAERSQAIQIPRPAFEDAMMSDYRIAKTVYHNLVLMLTARLRRSLQV